MTGRRAAWAFLVAAWTALGQVWGQDESRTEDWGPQPGDVTWSLRDHALTWTTPRLELTLDPWITFRHVIGTASSVAEQELTEPWDNLRGARFEARLDEVWEVRGSLEEWQGIPSAWDAMWMTDASALPHWGRAKITSGGRADVARARGRTSYVHQMASGDTLTWTGAYAPASWGHLASALTFSGRAASFPHTSLTWKSSHGFEAGGVVARWTGTERSPDGGSTESLFRQSDAGWGFVTWHGKDRAILGALVGATRERPWVGEMEADTAGRFAWTSWTSIQGRWNVPEVGVECAGEWASHQGWGVAVSARPVKGARIALSATRLAARADASVPHRNAGTPVADVLRPAGLETAAWRAELHGTYRLQRFSAGCRAAAVADARVAEAWVGFELQRTWPLHATIGVETWHVPGHPALPQEGTRLRLGVAHRMGMTAGSPTFDAP